MSVEHIMDHTDRICVVGLGYVGLPLACTLSGLGYVVTGLERDGRKVQQLAQGICPFDEPGLPEALKKARTLFVTDDPDELYNADIVMVCVETPIDEDRHPDYQALYAALHEIGMRMRPGMLVIIESTLAPGTMANVVAHILEEESDLAVTDFYLAHCPERIQPGHTMETLRNRPRVVGAMSPEAGEAALALYRQITTGDVDTTDCLTAELVKTAENAYRDVNIAFANSVALICEDLGADAWKVRELVNKCPYRQMHEPGAGVGGHCIPKDPWLLIANVKDPRAQCLIRGSRWLNEWMTLHVALLLEKALDEAGIELQGAHVAMLGYSYLPGSDDTRNSPSEHLAKALREAGAVVEIHDPYVAQYNGPLDKILIRSDAAVVMTAHEEYKCLNLSARFMPMVLIDGRHVFDAEDAQAAGLIYRGLGVG